MSTPQIIDEHHRVQAARALRVGCTAILKADGEPRPIIAVDVDGILTRSATDSETPRPENIAKVNALVRSGKYLVVLYTARPEDDRTVTERWLAKHGVRHHRLVMDKMVYDLLVDDKAMPDFPGTSLSDHGTLAYIREPSNSVPGVQKSQDVEQLVVPLDLDVEKGLKGRAGLHEELVTVHPKKGTAFRSHRWKGEGGAKGALPDHAAFQSAPWQRAAAAGFRLAKLPDGTWYGHVGEGKFVDAKGEEAKLSGEQTIAFRRIKQDYRKWAFVSPDNPKYGSVWLSNPKPGAYKWQYGYTRSGDLDRHVLKTEAVTDMVRDARAVSQKVLGDAKAGNEAALVLAVVQETGMRISDEDEKSAAGAFGATSMQLRHMTVQGSSVRFRFPTKSHQESTYTIDAAPAWLVRRLQERKAGKPGTARVFNISASSVRDVYMKRDTSPAKLGRFHPHHFRALKATELANRFFQAAIRGGLPEAVQEARALVKRVCEQVSVKIEGEARWANTARETYIVPRVWAPLEKKFGIKFVNWTKALEGQKKGK